MGHEGTASGRGREWTVVVPRPAPAYQWKVMPNPIWATLASPLSKLMA